MEYVAGFTVAHDVSARDWQLEENGGQWLLGKTSDSFLPLGPALVTKDEVQGLCFQIIYYDIFQLKLRIYACICFLCTYVAQASLGNEVFSVDFSTAIFRFHHMDLAYSCKTLSYDDNLCFEYIAT